MIEAQSQHRRDGGGEEVSHPKNGDKEWQAVEGHEQLQHHRNTARIRDVERCK